MGNQKRTRMTCGGAICSWRVSGKNEENKFRVSSFEFRVLSFGSPGFAATPCAPFLRSKSGTTKVAKVPRHGTSVRGHPDSDWFSYAARAVRAVIGCGDEGAQN